MFLNKDIEKWKLLSIFLANKLTFLQFNTMNVLFLEVNFTPPAPPNL